MFQFMAAKVSLHQVLTTVLPHCSGLGFRDPKYLLHNQFPVQVAIGDCKSLLDYHLTPFLLQCNQISMQKELENVKSGAKAEVDAAYRQLDEHSSKMHALLTSANQVCPDQLHDIVQALLF